MANETRHYNQLTEAEQERLSILIEECAEVIHAGTKILRHGHGVSNVADLERELSDLLWIYGLMCKAGDIQPQGVRSKPEAWPYLHHQGTL